MLEGFSYSQHGPLQWVPGRICISVDADDADFAVKMIRLHQEQQRRSNLKALLETPWDDLILGIDPVVLTERETDDNVGPSALTDDNAPHNRIIERQPEATKDGGA